MHTCLLVGLTVALAAPAPKEPPKKDAGIVGEWVGDKMIAGGMERPAPKGGITFTFAADGKMVIKESMREKAEEADYTIDSKKNPPEIDIVPPELKKGGNLAGIYKIEGDTLTICFAVSGERPKAFESPAGSTTMLMTLKRVKKE